jgi:RNA polymerase sigma-70 factor, ECF subfamily
MTDEALMRQYQAGNEDAFNALYQKYSPLVWSFIRKRLRASEAEDFYQKVWRQLHEKRLLYGDQPFAPWFFVLMRHLLIDEYRSLGRRKEFQDLLLEQIHGMEDKDQQVLELLKELPENTADLVRKYYLEGVSYEELEIETGLSQTNLRQRLSRALRGLREKL